MLSLLPRKKNGFISFLLGVLLWKAEHGCNTASLANTGFYQGPCFTILSSPQFFMEVNSMKKASPYPCLTQVITHLGWVGKGCFPGCNNRRALRYVFLQTASFSWQPPSPSRISWPHSDCTGFLLASPSAGNSTFTPLASVIPTWPIAGPTGPHYPSSVDGSVHQHVTLHFWACHRVLSPKE